MTTKTKSKKTATPLKDVEEPLKEVTVPSRFESPITGDYVDNVATPDTATVEVQAEDDTDISKKIYDIIEHEYPRTRVGTDGYLHAILCELIRARLRK